jgi:hypothetical protein
MDQKTISTKVALNAWQAQVDRAGKLISELSDEQLNAEIAPGRNRGLYLVGHLIAVDDAISEILGTGKKAYPDLRPVFIEAPDKTVAKIPSISELRQIWNTVHERLKLEFGKVPEDAWFTRHESMTDADFEKEPTRNKLSVLLSRTGHLAYHFGQLRLLK